MNRMIRLVHDNKGFYHVFISTYKINKNGMIISLWNDKEHKKITRSSAIRLADIIHAHEHDFNIGRYSMDIFAVIRG